MIKIKVMIELVIETAKKKRSMKDHHKTVAVNSQNIRKIEIVRMIVVEEVRVLRKKVRVVFKKVLIIKKV